MDWNKHLTYGIGVLIRLPRQDDFDQNKDKPYVYKKMQGSMVVFLVLYINDILLIRNDVGLLSQAKI